MRFYYGWIVVVISGFIMMLVMGSTVAVYGLYVLPVAEEFGLSRADVNTGFAVANLGGALMSPLIGRAADTFSVRLIMSVGALCYGFGFVALGLSHSMWMSAVILAAATPMMLGGIASFGAMTLVARWFEAQRARAMAIAVIGMSFGSIVMAPVVGWLISNLGWRNALIWQGVVIGLLFLMLISFLRDRPGPGDVEPVPKARGTAPASAAILASGPRAGEKPLSTKQLLRIPAFRILAPAMALGMGTFQAVTLSLIPMVQETGITITAAAGLLSVIGVTGIFGKFALAVIGDRLNKPLILAISLGLFAMVVAILPIPGGYSSFILLAGLIGLIGGALMPLFMAILADIVGSASFASANGMASLLIAVIGAGAIRLSGDIFDYTGTYQALFLMLAAAIATASLLMLICARMLRAAPAPAVA